jgi:hypothetical protein
MGIEAPAFDCEEPTTFSELKEPARRFSDGRFVSELKRLLDASLRLQNRTYEN